MDSFSVDHVSFVNTQTKPILVRLVLLRQRTFLCHNAFFRLRSVNTMARKHLTEAQRAEIRTLYFTAGLSKPKIVTLTGYGLGQVKRAIKEPIPQKRSGRPPVMTSEQQQELVEFITTSKENRRMGFLELSTTLFNGAFGEYAIRSTLRRLGYSRYVAYRKSPTF